MTHKKKMSHPSAIAANRALQEAIERRRIVSEPKPPIMETSARQLRCTCSRKLRQCDGNCLQWPLILVALLFCLPAQAQQPSLYLDFADTTCQQLLGPSHDSVALSNLGYELTEEWISIGTDTFTGFWQHERFFVPDRGIVLSIMDCGVTFDYVPHFGANQEPTTTYASRWDKFIHTKSQPMANWSRIAGYGLMVLGGYLGSEGERQRVINGLDSPAFHVNRDLSLACAFSAGASFTLSWSKAPHLKWWEPLVDATTGALAWYASAQKNWESYK